MAKEDIYLPVEMEKLEIEPTKVNISVNDENPFRKRRTPLPKRFAAKCACSATKKSLKNTLISKRGSSKLLKEPVLKFIHTCGKYGEGDSLVTVAMHSRLSGECSERPRMSQNLTSNTLNLSELVDNCKQLMISVSPRRPKVFPSSSYKEPFGWEKTHSSIGNQALAVGSSSGERNRAGGPSCSQQALNPPCDVTIDELASYFETLVHIPKKMSTMAEMMYI